MSPRPLADRLDEAIGLLRTALPPYGAFDAWREWADAWRSGEDRTASNAREMVESMGEAEAAYALASESFPGLTAIETARTCAQAALWVAQAASAFADDRPRRAETFLDALRDLRLPSPPDGASLV